MGRYIVRVIHSSPLISEWTDVVAFNREAGNNSKSSVRIAAAVLDNVDDVVRRHFSFASAGQCDARGVRNLQVGLLQVNDFIYWRVVSDRVKKLRSDDVCCASQ